MPGSQPLDMPMLRAMAERGEIDTIILAAPDMQGRLQGKRVMPAFFLANPIMEGCAYLLATDVECRPVPGYTLVSWEQGFGDFVFTPDLGTLRLAPWQPGAAIVLCDIEFASQRPVPMAPRTMLRRQLQRLAAHGLTAFAATELEFLLFRNSYEEAWDNAYRGLTPTNQYNNDYSILGTARVEPIIRKLRNAMEAAGIQVENSKGENNFGQHEINFAYREAMITADQHVIYKEAAKEIAAEAGHALTFMAKFNEREGNSCHVHLSLRDRAGQSAFLAADGHSPSKLFLQFLAGLLAHTPALMPFYAPNINSYKRYAPGSFAPTTLAWGLDNRTCAFRVVGHGESLRVENRLPGGDVNPYLALAAMIAAGLDGIERDLPPAPAFTGNAYDADLPRVPQTLHEAAPLFAASEFTRAAFGADVVAHYANMAKVELDTFNAAVTDWERFRSFERM
ncbi:MAG TPA: glutamine synthetase family protein [Acidocella sp.]|jgi:glutamine synthetase|uniref:glutamine synthetase family protein n=1 Tax=Acidocella sp. TaxID=50710 RepID=UPI002C7A5A3F|nr:glutamine synthetase family protein [Acidocella sp.]HVE22842.1 glutamine synthetase family protein [Acidocella sp.]